MKDQYLEAIKKRITELELVRETHFEKSELNECLNVCNQITGLLEAYDIILKTYNKTDEA